MRGTLLVCLCVLALCYSLSARSAGPPANVSGLTGVYCTQCHRTNALNSGNGSVRLEGLPNAWIPGQVYPLRLVVAHDTARRWGFQLSATGPNGEQAGALLPSGDGRNAVITDVVNGSTIQFIEHTSLGSAIDGSNVFEFSFRAPANASLGRIRFNFAGNAANGNGANTGDFIYASELFVPPATAADNRTFDFQDRGGISIETVGRGDSAVIAHARAQANSGSTASAGVEILTLSQNNVIVSESAFEAGPAIRGGRIYAQIGSGFNTGLAISNPNTTPATVSFFFTDDNGVNFGTGTTIIAPNSQIAGFLDQSRFSSAIPAIQLSNSRTFTFTADNPVSALAVRGFINERSEFIMAPLPVADLASSLTDSLSIANIADGEGWTTQVLLVNPTDSAISGNLQFLSSTGQSLTVTIAGQSATQFAYSIPARSSRRFQTSGSSTTGQTGSVRIVPASGNRSPAASAVMSLRSSNVTTTEVAMNSTRLSSAFRVYVEGSTGFVLRQAGSVMSGVSIANHGTSSATVDLNLTMLDGSQGFSGMLTVPAQGQTSVFLNQVPGFAGLPASFQGVLRLSTSGAVMSVSGFRVRYNERSTLLISGVPASNESAGTAATEVVFPHIVDSGGYSTQVVLYSGSAGQSSAGVLRFYSQGGLPVTLTLK